MFAQEFDGEGLRVSLWSLNMLQKDRKTENEAWLEDVRQNQRLCLPLVPITCEDVLIVPGSCG